MKAHCLHGLTIPTMPFQTRWLLRTLPLAMLLGIAPFATAQKPIYLCEGVYTDAPCRGGKEVDILPSRGVTSLSGRKRESLEATIESTQTDMVKSQQQGIAEASRMVRCDGLQRQRQAIDASSTDSALRERRFAIRQEQHRLNCRNN